jgi:type I restriction enzyme S subunit
VKTMKLLLPNQIGVLQAFEALAGTLMDRVNANAGLGLTLVELRDTLLPRLISGKLRVPEAEKMMEAVL